MSGSSKKVVGIGITDVTVLENGKVSKCYECWRGMIERCYSKKRQTKNPSYVGCTVCEEWLYFSNFKTWYDANYKEGCALDKDILVEGNKIYSPNTCVFVPQSLNCLLIDNRSARGKYPLGVSARMPNVNERKINITYKSSCHNGYNKNLTKTFKTITEAQDWYNSTKIRVVKEQVDIAIANGYIDKKVADALLKRVFK